MMAQTYNNSPLQYWLGVVQFIVNNVPHTWYLILYAWEKENLSGVLKDLVRVDCLLKRIGRRATYDHLVIWREVAWSLFRCVVNAVLFQMAVGFRNPWAAFPTLMSISFPIPLMAIYGIPLNTLLHVVETLFRDLSQELTIASPHRYVLLARLHRALCSSCQKINLFSHTVLLVKSAFIFFMVFTEVFNVMKAIVRFDQFSSSVYVLWIIAHLGYLFALILDAWVFVFSFSRVSQKVI
jgi:hypothetical protein